MTEIVDETLSLLFQPTCVLCHALVRKGCLCENCKPIAPILGPCCNQCGASLPQPMRKCGACPGSSLHQVRSSLWLTDEAKKILHGVKYGGRAEYINLFKEAALSAFTMHFPQRSEIIPVPLNIDRLLQRGFNQSSILAEWIAQEWSVKPMVGKLIKAKATLPQSTLSKGKRRKNLRGSFSWLGKDIAPQVLLVDDVYTTGATLEICSEALLRAGAERVYGWTLFRVPAMKLAPFANTTIL